MPTPSTAIEIQLMMEQLTPRMDEFRERIFSIYSERLLAHMADSVLREQRQEWLAEQRLFDDGCPHVLRPTRPPMIHRPKIILWRDYQRTI